jgi:hypothetical protein
LGDDVAVAAIWDEEAAGTADWVGGWAGAA